MDINNLNSIGTMDDATIAIIAIATVIIVLTVLALAIVKSVFRIIACWQLFNKVNEKGWKSIIPVYNKIVLYKSIGVSRWWIVLEYSVLFLAILINLQVAGLGIFIIYIMTIIANYIFYIYFYLCLGRAFGKSEGFKIGLIYLNTIFLCILAFGKSEYKLNKENDVEVKVEIEAEE